jgi:AraC-like DNA-binding protein
VHSPPNSKESNMDDFFKYVSPGPDDIDWGLFINCVGKATITPNTIYPPKGHPTGYFFVFERGRTLQEYQIHYITEGEGIYQNSEGKFKVKSGSIMITRPTAWHTFRPKKTMGWIEHYLGFSGTIADDLFHKDCFLHQKAVIEIGIREEILDTYYKLFDILLQEKPGYQQVAAGMTMKLLGYIISFGKQKNFTETRVEKVIRKACFLMRENVTGTVDFKQFAQENNIGYSYFRKKFKLYTGVPPVQYHLDLKTMQAKEMLISSDKLIKEISAELGFQSVYYFSRVFKSKIGMSPNEFRKNS